MKNHPNGKSPQEMQNSLHHDILQTGFGMGCKITESKMSCFKSGFMLGAFVAYCILCIMFSLVPNN